MLTYCFGKIEQALLVRSDYGDTALYIIPSIPKIHVIHFLSPLNSKLP